MSQIFILCIPIISDVTIIIHDIYFPADYCNIHMAKKANTIDNRNTVNYTSFDRTWSFETARHLSWHSDPELKCSWM